MKSGFVSCPQCGADIEVEHGVTQFNCPRCGHGIFIDDQIDEDSLTTQVEEDLKLQSPAKKKKKVRNIIGMLIAIMLFTAVGFFLGRLSDGHSAKSIQTNASISQGPQLVCMPFSSKEASELDYEEVCSRLAQAGFVNILGKEITKKPLLKRRLSSGTIKTISIMAGDESVKKFKKDQVFKSDAEILIEYYQFD